MSFRFYFSFHFYFSLSFICRLPCSPGPLPRIPSYSQGSYSSRSPWRQACQCVCGQRVVPLPKQLPASAQVSIQDSYTCHHVKYLFPFPVISWLSFCSPAGSYTSFSQSLKGSCLSRTPLVLWPHRWSLLIWTTRIWRNRPDMWVTPARGCGCCSC